MAIQATRTQDLFDRIEVVDAKARIQYMDEEGIYAQVFYPNVGGFGSARFLSLKEPKLMLACVRAYNDFLTEWTSETPDRLIAVTATPFWDVDETVKEIERCDTQFRVRLRRENQPAISSSPPSGVTGPSQRGPESTSR